MSKVLVTKKHVSALMIVMLLTASTSYVRATSYDYFGNYDKTNPPKGYAIEENINFNDVNYTLHSDSNAPSNLDLANDVIKYEGMTIVSKAAGPSVTVNVNGSYTANITNAYEYNQVSTNYGVQIYNDQTTKPLTLNVNGNFSTNMQVTGEAQGINAGSHSVVNLNGKKNKFFLEGKGDSVIGIHTVGIGMHVTGDTDIDVTDNVDRATHGRAQGINVETQKSGDYDGTVVFDGTVDVKAKGVGNNTIVDGINHLSNTLTFNNAVTVDISGVGNNEKQIKGLNLSSTDDSTTNFNGTLAIKASGTANSTVVGIDSRSSSGKKEVNFEKKVTIDSTGHGIFSQNGTFTFNDDAYITASESGVFTKRDSTAPTGDVEFKKGLIVKPQDRDAAASFIALTTGVNGIINVNTANQNGEVQLTGDIKAEGGAITTNLTTDTSFITGNLSSANNGTVTVDINDKGVLTGNSTLEDGNSTLDVILKNGARWNVTDTGNNTTHTSTLSKIELGANSIVDLSYATGNQSIKMFDLIGNGGTFILGSDVTQNVYNDKVLVTNDFTGEAKLMMVDINGASELTEGAKGTVLASTKGTGEFTSATTETPLHWLEYELRKQDAADAATYEYDWVIAGLSKQPSDKLPPTVDTIMSSAIGSYYLWRDNDKLMQRLGDLRQSKNEDQGIWARIIRNGTEYDHHAYFHNNTSTMQLGYDKVISRDAKDDYWVIGGAIGYQNGSSSYHHGSGDNSAATFSLYGTRMGSKGHYLDLVAKAGKYNHHFDTYMMNGFQQKGDYDTLGYSISAEYGRKNVLKHGWYVEPQMQLTFGHLNSLDYVTTNGLKVSQDGINSAIGRVGFNIGRNIGNKANFYLKANLNHEFGGSGHVSMATWNDNRDEDLSLDDTWVTYGLGVAAPMSKDSHMYFDIERSSGSHFTTDWQWNAGMRFNI